jgi:hypothetical protein
MQVAGEFNFGPLLSNINALELDAQMIFVQFFFADLI